MTKYLEKSSYFGSELWRFHDLLLDPKQSNVAEKAAEGIGVPISLSRACTELPKFLHLLTAAWTVGVKPLTH